MSKPIKNNFKLEAFYVVVNTQFTNDYVETSDKNRECGINLILVLKSRNIYGKKRKKKTSKNHLYSSKDIKDKFIGGD